MQNFPSSPSDPQHQQTKPGRRVTHLMHQLRQDCTRISLPTLAHLCPPPTEKTHNPFNTVDPIPIPDPSQETRLTTSPPHICKHNSHQVSLQSYNPIAIWNPMEIPVQLLDRRAGVYRTRTATPARPSTYCARIASQLRIAPGFKTAVMAKK